MFYEGQHQHSWECLERVHPTPSQNCLSEARGIAPPLVRLGGSHEELLTQEDPHPLTDRLSTHCTSSEGHHCVTVPFSENPSWLHYITDSPYLFSTLNPGVLPLLCDLRQVLHLSGPAATCLSCIPNQDGMGNSATHPHLEILGFQTQAHHEGQGLSYLPKVPRHTVDEPDRALVDEALLRKDIFPPLRL